MRLFFAFWPDDPVTEAICAIQSEARQSLSAASKVPRKRLHLTLSFLGDIGEGRLPELVSLTKALRWTAFPLMLDHLGSWIPPGVVWLGPTSVPGALERLKADLDEQLIALGVPVERRVFRPHVTLYRHARHGVRMQIQPVQWQVERLALVYSRSEAGGTRYDPLVYSTPFIP